MLAKAIELEAFMWYVFFLVPTGRGSQLNMLSPAEREDVLHWLHDVSDRIAIKTTEAPQYRRVAFQRDEAQQKGEALPERGELYHWLSDAADRGARPQAAAATHALGYQFRLWLRIH